MRPLASVTSAPLGRAVASLSAQATGSGWDEHPSEQVIDRMLDEFDRPGKLEGKGFYAYEDGKRTGLWPGLKEAFGGANHDIPFQDLEERMLFIEALESCVRQRQVQQGLETVRRAGRCALEGLGGGLQGFRLVARALQQQQPEVVQ